jgi:hypothetical protein
MTAMALGSFFRFARAVVFASLGAPLALACSSTSSNDDGDTGDDDVTEAPQTGVRDQSDTGNCWLYATAGWMESLEYAALIKKGKASASDPATRPLHFSPAYWDYWDWYTKITSGTIKGKKSDSLKDGLDSGGSWGAAVEIAARYGMTRTRMFIGDDVHEEASHSLAALAAMTDSLSKGALKTAASRKDRALVRQELDKAFGLKPEVIDALTRAFGDGSKTFQAGTGTANEIVISPASVEIQVPRRDSTPVLIPLSKAIGDRAPGDDPDARVGAMAWNVVPYQAKSAAATREYFRRIQRALHENVPLPISWYVASNGDDDDTGKYVSIPAAPADSDESGGHETLVTDYEVDGVPGFGKLAAGATASKEAEKASLDEHAKIVFLRVKNSWGNRVRAQGPAGYNDLYFDYLTGTLRACPKGVAPKSKKCTNEVPLQDVTLPAGF